MSAWYNHTELEFEFGKVIYTDLLLRDIKIYILHNIRDFNCCGPELTTEYRRDYRLYGINSDLAKL